MSEITVGIRELKSRLSKYVRQVKSGASLVITEHGKPVGQIVPVRPTLERRLRQLVESQVISWSGRRLASKVPRVELRGRKTVAEMLLEDRE